MKTILQIAEEEGAVLTVSLVDRYWKNDGGATFQKEALERFAARIRAAQQAEIDRLMLEFCPLEMTEEQIANWAKHQVPVDAKTQALIDKAAIRNASPESDIDQATRTT